MTKHEIIDYVVDHYKTNPRSITSGGLCRYNGLNGEKCAFAILCSNPKELIEWKDADTLINAGIAKLKPKFDGHSAFFYKQIQNLHDDNTYWNKTPEGNELSQRGIEKVNELKEYHK